MTNPVLEPVFSPADEELRFKFGGAFGILKANDITEVPQNAVPVILTQLGDLGVVHLPPGISKTEFDRIVSAAENKYWANQHKKSEDIIITAYEREQRRRAAGLPAAPESDEVKLAKQWLAEHKNPPTPPQA